MTVAIESDVKRVIGPKREGKLVQAHDRAWDDWVKDRARYSRWARSRATMFFERLATHLQSLFADDPGVRFLFHDETFKVVIDDLVVLRFKKANGKGFGANVPTQANFAFIDSEPDLFGLGGQKVEAVYTLDDLGTKIKSIAIQARDGDVRLWAYALDRNAGSGAATVVPLPVTPLSPLTDSADLVHAKKPESDEQDESDEGGA